jgi:hypothetical protein
MFVRFATIMLIKIMLIYSTKCATGEAGTIYPAGPHEFTHGFSGICVSQSNFLCSVWSINVCPLYFGHCIVISLRFTASHYTFDIFKTN